MEKLTLEQAIELENNIKNKGLLNNFKKEIAYFYKLYRLKKITETEYLRAHDLSLTTIGR